MRITPQGTPPKNPAAFLNETLNDDFFSELDKAFERIQMVPEVTKKTPRRRAKKTETELAKMHSTFVDVAQVHLRPVMRYLKAIQLGVASKDLCEIVHYVVGPIISKTRKVGLADQTHALIGFQRALKEAVKGSSRKISGENRTKLTDTFAPVQKVFSLEFRGHSTAVVNLLGFYKAVRRNPNISESEIRKLFAIGIPSLTMLRKSSIEELVSLSGIAPEKMSALRRSARKFNLLSIV